MEGTRDSIGVCMRLLKHVVDSALLQSFTGMELEKRKKIAEGVERGLVDVERKINGMGDELL